jgi:hypothetical protein
MTPPGGCTGPARVADGLACQVMPRAVDPGRTCATDGSAREAVA